MSDTIVARATAAGKGGVGIIRVSGPKVVEIALQIVGTLPSPRYAHFTPFFDNNQQIIDEGIALYFPNPHSFTGEDVLELQGHGGPVILDCLIERILDCGARLARPGEFSERAFLNDKLDLAQAEAVCDLINASSKQAAKSAMRSLQGDFSKTINELVEKVSYLRCYVEAAMDFPEEEIDFLSDHKITQQLQQIITDLKHILSLSQQGLIIQEGINIVLAGKPNVGKSSLLNCLSGRDSAIVTDIPGTTRDALKEHLQIDGIPLHVTDTAGLRDSHDIVEQEGIKRALGHIQQADFLLLLTDECIDESDPLSHLRELLPLGIDEKPVVILCNKIDLTKQTPQHRVIAGFDVIFISAKNRQGIDILGEYLKGKIGFTGNQESEFTARRRHVDAVNLALTHVETGYQQLYQHQAGELLAEDLLQAQNVLGTITGKVTSDDLLGEIFSSFCIGK